MGASGLVAASAEAAAPTIPSSYVNRPAVSGVSDVTPESATVSGVIDTGGNPASVFNVPAGTTISWDASFNLATGSYQLDGLPSSGSSMGYNTNQAATVLNNAGADNFSTVTFEYDPASDYAANGNNPGPETGFATETDVPTYPGLSSVSAEIGGYPAASATSLSGALTPGTKYDYWIVQQPGQTNAAETVNTFSGSATGTNPTWSCYPDSYIAAVSPYNGYTATGTISGGLNSSGTAQTTPQPQIQGPCDYDYGNSAYYYDSAPGTFTTPKLGSVKVGNGAVKGSKVSVLVMDQSVEGAKGNVELDYKGKEVAAENFALSAQSTKTVTMGLTSYGKKLVAKDKTVTVTVVASTTTDQPIGTKSVTI